MPAVLPVRRVPRTVVGLFFGSLLLLGAGLFRDYGVSWDEPVDRQNGLVSLRYAAGRLAPAWAARQPRLRGVPNLAGYVDNNHGVLFELPLAWLDVVRPGTEARTTYLLRHAAVFLVCWAGTWALFGLARLHLRDERLALLAAALLVLSPRFFAESFYNGKDLVFTALFTVGAYAAARLLARPTLGRALVAGLATAAATDVRLLGLLLAPMVLALLAVGGPGPASGFGPNPASLASRWRAGLAYALAAALGTVAGWPYLWESPLAHLLDAWRSLSHFHWGGSTMLYLGQQITDADLPWHYPLVWLSVTTPLAYQVAGLLGLGVAAAALLRHPRVRLRQPSGQLDALLAGWLVLPLVLVIGLHSVLYDGWRHLYFIYPALLLLAVRGGQWLWQQRGRSAGWRALARGLGGLAAAEAVFTAGRMVAMHPFEQTFFSYLPARQVERLFERDYWALSYRQGLEFVVARQPRGVIALDVSHVPPLDNNKVWLSAADRARLVLQPGAAGRYLITAYRHTPGAYPDTVGREVYAIRANGVKILSVFWRQRAGSAPPSW